MTLALTLSAIRRHPLSVALSVLLVVITARAAGGSVALTLALWAAASVLSLETWFAFEPIALKRFGRYREPTAAERQRLGSAVASSQLYLLIADTGDLATARGLRCLVVGRDVLEVFEDRALSGLLHQTATSIHSANLAGFILIWLGNLPVLAARYAGRLVGKFGRLLAVVVGTSLVLPLVLWRDQFVCWTGRLFAALLTALIGLTLIYDGYAMAGLGVVAAWVIVPTLRASLSFESRRAGYSADAATVTAGLGPQLLEALDFLALAEPLAVTDTCLRVLCLPRATSVERAERIRRQLSMPHV